MRQIRGQNIRQGRSRLFEASLLATVFALATQSCSLLFIENFEVVSWSWNNTSLRIEFSHTPDTYSVEANLQVRQNGEPMLGWVSWQGSTIQWQPYGGFLSNHDYEVVVSSKAQSATAINLKRDFAQRFSTYQTSGARPRVESWLPVSNATLDPEDLDLRVAFSLAMDPSKLHTALRIDPALLGLWSLDASGRLAQFMPFVPASPGTRYTVSVAGDWQALGGQSLGIDTSWSFVVGTDTRPPELVEVYALDPDGTASALTPGIRTSVSTKAGLRFVWDEEVALANVENLLEVQGGPALKLSAIHQGSTHAQVVELVSKEAIAWQTLWQWSLKAGVQDRSGNTAGASAWYQMAANLAEDQAPRLLGIGIPQNPSTPGEAMAYFVPEQPYQTFVPDLVSGYPINTSVETVWEVYIELGPGGDIDLFSVMEHLGLRSNNGSFDVMPRVVRRVLGSDREPRAEWASYHRVMIQIQATNRSNTGLLTLELRRGLADSLGRSQVTTQSVVMVK